MNKQTLFFSDKPLFGLDVGHGTVRVMALDSSANKQSSPGVIGYGAAAFDPAALDGGVIVKPEIIAESVVELFKHDLVGSVTTRRVALSLPTSHVFTRTMTVPQNFSKKEMDQAVHMETEQYVPIPIEDIYVDYTNIGTKDDQNELLIVAAPKKLVDSYIDLTNMLDLEPILLETSVSSGVRMFSRGSQNDVPALLIDFGSESADITVYDNGLVVSGTVPCGGETFTRLISQSLKVTLNEAETIKSKYGLGASKKQGQINKALDSTLQTLLREIRRTMRYYSDQRDTAKIGQIVIIGGGAGMPGLADYLTDNLRLPVRTLDPTSYLDFGELQPINPASHTSYVTVAGLSLVSPTEIFA